MEWAEGFEVLVGDGGDRLGFWFGASGSFWSRVEEAGVFSDLVVVAEVLSGVFDEGKESFDDVGVFVGEVDFFGGVCVEVVEGEGFDGGVVEASGPAGLWGVICAGQG